MFLKTFYKHRVLNLVFTNMLQVKKVAVVSTDKREDEAGASYTVYVLAVTGADGQQWGSARRGPCAAIPHWQCGLGIWDSHMNENGVRKDDGAVLGIRCVWSFRGRSPGKDWRFPVKSSLKMVLKTPNTS